MAALTKKQKRTIEFALKHFFSLRALSAPKSTEDLKVPNWLSRQLMLPDGRVLPMTEEGLRHLRTIVSEVSDANVFNGLAGYSDVDGACRNIFAEALSLGRYPDGADELLDLIRTRLGSEMTTRVFAVLISGIEFVGIDALELGTMRLVLASKSHLDAANVKYDPAFLAKAIGSTKANFWLMGSARGTQGVAEARFRGQASLVAGMLAISAASMHENGATGFRIGAVMSPVQARGKAIWLSWIAPNRNLTIHIGGDGLQNFKINAALAEQFKDSGVFANAFALFQKEHKSPLEEAIVNAVYWYSDAHREAEPVMKLVKYWSCVESFFSSGKEKVTQSVSAGLATVLVFGGFEFLPRSAYIETKKRITKLYGLRSKALHRANYRHVSSEDASRLSQWVAWMLINMVQFAGSGYTNLGQVTKNSERLDALVTGRKTT